VRVAASNLRARLDDYYAGTGLHDPVEVVLPKGTYVPAFRWRAGRTAKKRALKYAAAAVVVAALGAVALWWWTRAPQGPSVAVFPFVVSGLPAGEEHLGTDFSAGIAASLARVPELHVAAPGTTLRYLGRDTDIRIAGRELGVGAVVEGSVRASEGHLRIMVQLIDVTNGYSMWSHIWDTDRSRMPEVREELTAAVVTALRRTSRD
jgi:TolB-like protein